MIFKIFLKYAEAVAEDFGSGLEGRMDPMNWGWRNSAQDFAIQYPGLNRYIIFYRFVFISLSAGTSLSFPSAAPFP